MARDAEDTVEYEHMMVERETDAAILVIIDKRDIWIPKSQIHETSEVRGDGDTGTLVITEWIAKQKGLI